MCGLHSQPGGLLITVTIRVPNTAGTLRTTHPMRSQALQSAKEAPREVPAGLLVSPSHGISSSSPEAKSFEIEAIPTSLMDTDLPHLAMIR